MTNTKTKQKEKIKVNLNTYYILPLLKLNMQSWGESNFIKSQVTKYGEVVVFIKNKEVASDYWNHENYAADIDEEDETTMIIYNIPERFMEDYQLFLDSKYSLMSMFAKDAIKAHAKANGLIWMKMIKKDLYQSSRELLALDREEGLREALEEELDVKISPNAELWSKLGEEEFIKLD